jgi:1-acyl-sn-glycerol-3-phosphate acyltransferase
MVTVKIASEPWEFEQIHALNHRTFAEEIPRYEANADRRLVDRFHGENTYVIAVHNGRVAGMVAIRDRRPFSLDERLPNLDAYLPSGRSACELRLLAVERSHRQQRVLPALLQYVWQYCRQRGFTLAVISGTTRQLKLYAHLGFVPFGPLIGSPDALFQPMMLTLERFAPRAPRLFRARKKGDRGIATLIFTGYMAVVLLVTMPAWWVVLVCVPAGPIADRALRLWSRLVLRASSCRVRLTGAEFLQRTDSMMLVSNHASYIDSVVLKAVLPVGVCFVANHSVLDWPLVGTAVRKARYLIVDRGSKHSRLACGASMIEHLRRGLSLVVYPEGRRGESTRLLPFRLGAFRAAVEAGRPIVPISLAGTARILERDRWVLRRGPIDVTIHPPIDPVARDRAEMVRVRRLARERIVSSHAS